MSDFAGEKRLKAAAFASAAFLVLLDRISKALVLSSLAEGQSIPVIPGLFHITLVFNKGIAFGLFRGWTPLFIATNIAVMTALLIYLVRFQIKRPAIAFSCGMLLAGAVGNLIDRVLCGHVIDFLDFRIWPVFNIADSCITVGATVLAAALYLSKGRGS